MQEKPARSASVAFAELLDAFEFTDVGGDEHRAYIDARTGRIYLVSDLDDPDEPMDDVPEDLEESDVYIELPDKGELNLGRPLALSFVAEALPDQWELASEIFRSRGAYRRFKDLLARHGVLERWYAYEAAATEQALRDWCEANAIILDEAAR